MLWHRCIDTVNMVCEIVLPRVVDLVIYNTWDNPNTHTCDIFFEPDREIWDFSEGDWGLR